MLALIQTGGRVGGIGMRMGEAQFRYRHVELGLWFNLIRHLIA